MSVAAPDPNYDMRAALYRFAPGIVPTREIDDAMAVQYAANNFTPLTKPQILAIAGPLPALPAGYPRFADSNPSPGDNWSIERSEAFG